MLPTLITRFVGWVISVFHEVERVGPAVPSGPVILAANHPNALVDPMVLFRTAGRPSRPLAKAPLFHEPLVGTVLRALGGLPVYRRQDDPALMEGNQGTFDAAVASLHRSEAIQIYPEGISHSFPSMVALKTGAARIALQAEASAGWGLGLVIQPVGLTYTRKHLFRGRVVAAYGMPIGVSDFRARYEEDPTAAVRALTDEVSRSLRELTLNLEQSDDRALVETAERIYASARRLAPSRERVPMARRLPRLQRFARGVAWLRATDPDRYADVLESVNRYRHLLALLGARDGDVPSRYRVGGIVRYVARQALFLVCVLPVAATGAVFWAPPYFATRHLAPRFRPDLDQVATYKLAVAILAFPLWLAFWSIPCFLVLGVRGAVGLWTLGPVVGLAALAWKERGGRVLEDARIFWRVLGRPRSRAWMTRERGRLVEIFEELAEEMPEDYEPPGPSTTE